MRISEAKSESMRQYAATGTMIRTREYRRFRAGLTVPAPTFAREISLAFATIPPRLIKEHLIFLFGQLKQHIVQTAGFFSLSLQLLNEILRVVGETKCASRIAVYIFISKRANHCLYNFPYEIKRRVTCSTLLKSCYTVKDSFRRQRYNENLLRTGFFSLLRNSEARAIYLEFASSGKIAINHAT